LETGEIHRLGADRIEKRVDVRILAATNRNLLGRIASGDFREDLYYRLNVIHVEIPPLRERQTDIPLLFNHYLQHYCRTHSIDVPTLPQLTQELLLAYRWPGNVRELKNIAERIAVRQDGGVVRPDMLPAEMRDTANQKPIPTVAADGTATAVVPRPAADAAWNEI